MDADALLVDLDPDQLHAVTTPSRQVAVLAGAGSGKTRVLTRRVAWRVATGSAEPAHTLVLTFTREAAGELRRRLTRLGIGTPIDAGTFHSTALSLLRRRWADTDRRELTVLEDRRRLVSDVVAAMDPPPKGRLEDIVADLTWALARGLTADDVTSAARRVGRRSPTLGVLPDVMQGFAALKRRRGVLDLDDVLRSIVDEMNSDTGFAAAVRWQYRHLFVDEAQDLNPLQHRFLDALRHGVDDVFVVGDPAQSIYGFNGADPSFFDSISDRFDAIEIIRLPVNHRCTPQIVAAGSHVLGYAGAGVAAGAEHLVSSRGDGAAVALTAFPDADAEADAVASAIAASDPDLIRGCRLAVLARTNAQCGRITDALGRVGVPVMQRRIPPGELRDALDHVQRLSAHGLRTWAHDTIEAAGDTTVHPDRIRVADAVFEFVREHPAGDGAALRAWVLTTDPFDVQAEAGVEVLTFHAAKGREWFGVWVTGTETGLVPHRASSTVAARQEEARLAYVAITRATDECHITWAERRGGYRRDQSPFLDGFVSTGVVAAPPPPSLLADGREREGTRRNATLAAMRTWREDAARRAGILPDALCTDRQLSLLVDHPPVSAVELAELTGLGQITAARLYPSLALALAAV